jgi:hypothetical protein
MPLEDNGAFNRISARLKGVEVIDAADLAVLLEEWERVIIEDNRRGVLAGLDKDGVEMQAVTYRGQTATAKPRARSGAFRGSNLKGNRKGVIRELGLKGGRIAGRTPKGAEKVVGGMNRFKGVTTYSFTGSKGAAILPNNNLATRVYKQLDGPPLAPRREASRVISNLMTEHDTTEMSASGGWAEVVSPKGVPFLKAHFNGENGLPVRDLRGVRPWGVAQARAAVRKWASWLLGGHS